MTPNTVREIEGRRDKGKLYFTIKGPVTYLIILDTEYLRTEPEFFIDTFLYGLDQVAPFGIHFDHSFIENIDGFTLHVIDTYANRKQDYPISYKGLCALPEQSLQIILKLLRGLEESRVFRETVIEGQGFVLEEGT